MTSYKIADIDHVRYSIDSDCDIELDVDGSMGTILWINLDVLKKVVREAEIIAKREDIYDERI